MDETGPRDAELDSLPACLGIKPGGASLCSSLRLARPAAGE